MNESVNNIVDLMPTLQKVRVPAGKLILDPNNPRFLEHDDNLTHEDNFLDPGIVEETHNKMRKETYKINQLENSIVTNGWQPVDQIFVRKHQDTDYYIVQEGNRRVTAIRNLLKKSDLDEEIKQSIENLDVMEIVSDCDSETLKIRISYLLGVRHHGSLKKWSAFAQAHNIYERYLSAAKQSDVTFQWNSDLAQLVANALSMDLNRIEQRLKVYCVMKQLDIAVGGMKARYYSLCEEVLLKGGKSKLPEYIQQDPVTFLLNEDSIERMDNLCHFSTPNRELAPIRNPSEWRKFDKILQELDEQRRAELIAEVEVIQRRPSDVWAERVAEIIVPRWETWLQEVSHILSRVQFGDDLESPEAKAVGQRLGELLDKLKEKISPQEGGNSQQGGDNNE